MVSIHPTMYAHRRNWTNTRCDSHCGLPEVGIVTHADNNSAEFSRGSTAFVDRLPMLTNGLLRTEPTFASAIRALHKLYETLPQLCFAVAPATVCNHPGLRGYFHI